MNKFDILLSLLAKVQEDYIGTQIEDMGGYSDMAFVELKLQDGASLKIDVVCKEPEQEQKNEEQ